MSNIHPTAIISDGAVIHDSAEIGPFCMIGPNVQISANTKLIGNVTIMGETKIGSDCVLYPQVTLGGSAQVLNAGNPDCKLEIGNRNTFRENVTVHGASPHKEHPTRIGDDCFMMVSSHVAHDCQIGNKCVLANGASIGGECIIGDQVWFGGGTFVHQKTWVGEHAFIGGGCIQVGDVIPYASTQGNHAEVVTLNVVGLKRRGFAKSDIRAIHQCVRSVFESEGRFSERLDSARKNFADVPFANKVIEFIDSPRSGRALCGYRRSK